MLKFFIIFIVLIIFIFIKEIIKVIVKAYRKKKIINKDKCFTLMCNIDDMCKKHGIKYYFSEGTALGLYKMG